MGLMWTRTAFGKPTESPKGPRWAKMGKQIVQDSCKVANESALEASRRPKMSHDGPVAPRVPRESLGWYEDGPRGPLYVPKQVEQGCKTVPSGATQRK